MIINRCNIRALASDAAQGGDAPMSGSGQDSEVTENAEKSGATVGEPGGDAATLQAALAEVTQKFNETNDRMYRI
ncbi:MAG: hypothetical protein RI953_1570, partial [Pseudomonadota bacterium]